MRNFIDLLKKELTIHFEFYGDYPYARIGWVWVILIIFLGYYTFGITLCVLLLITTLVNLINRH
jgi:hypothetical protein